MEIPKHEALNSKQYLNCKFKLLNVSDFEF